MIRKLHWQILIAILLGTVAGIMSGQEAQIFGIRFYDMFSFVGELFLNALKMIIVPLISASIITGASNLGGANLGRLGGKTLAFYMFSSAAAILIGRNYRDTTQTTHAFCQNANTGGFNAIIIANQ